MKLNYYLILISLEITIAGWTIKFEVCNELALVLDNNNTKLNLQNVPVKKISKMFYNQGQRHLVFSCQNQNDIWTISRVRNELESKLQEIRTVLNKDTQAALETKSMDISIDQTFFNLLDTIKNEHKNTELEKLIDAVIGYTRANKTQKEIQQTIERPELQSSVSFGFDKDGKPQILTEYEPDESYNEQLFQQLPASTDPNQAQNLIRDHKSIKSLARALMMLFRKPAPQNPDLFPQAGAVHSVEQSESEAIQASAQKPMKLPKRAILLLTRVLNALKISSLDPTAPPNDTDLLDSSVEMPVPVHDPTDPDFTASAQSKISLHDLLRRHNAFKRPKASPKLPETRPESLTSNQPSDPVNSTILRAKLLSLLRTIRLLASTSASPDKDSISDTLLLALEAAIADHSLDSISNFTHTQDPHLHHLLTDLEDLIPQTFHIGSRAESTSQPNSTLEKELDSAPVTNSAMPLDVLKSKSNDFNFTSSTPISYSFDLTEGLKPSQKNPFEKLPDAELMDKLDILSLILRLKYLSHLPLVEVLPPSHLNIAQILLKHRKHFELPKNWLTITKIESLPEALTKFNLDLYPIHNSEEILYAILIMILLLGIVLGSKK